MTFVKTPEQIANPTSFAMWKGERPVATTTSVHSAGSDASSPLAP